MPYESENLIQISAGETTPDQLAGIKFYSYGSDVDAITGGATPMSGSGYFNDLAPQLKWGSLIMLSDDANQPVLYEVTSQTGETPVALGEFKQATNVPSPYYATVAEAPVEFLTAGGDTDTFPYVDSLVGNYANYSLNSEVLVTGPPGASSGIQFLECQAGQIFVKWLRPAIAGQTVKLWLQVRSATPTP